MGLDVHKNSVYITEMDNDGNIMDQYEIENNEDAWNSFRSQYIDLKPEIALEMSTSGKYVSVLLRDMGFSVHVADPVKLALIYNTPKKNDREDSYKLAKLLRLGDLSEVHVPSREADELRSLVRYRKSLGEEMTMIKNKIHAILTAYGISIKATDIFGKRGLRIMEKSSHKIRSADRFVMSHMLESVVDLKHEENEVEDEIARSCEQRKDMKIVMTIPGINVYSAAAIMSEIDDIRRFSSKEKLASYAGLVPRQDQSGNRDIRGHITKHGPSMLRYVLINAAHTVIKYSNKMRKKYLSLVRRVGRNRAIVAIARVLLETIYVMLTREEEFVDRIDDLTERKMKSMSERAKHEVRGKDLDEAIKFIREERIQKVTKGNFS